jgi:valyl-tRNA synthetase
MNTAGKDTGVEGGELEFSLPDRWIRSRLNVVTQQVNDTLSQYRFDLAAQAIYEFTWNEYCDWYLELSKPLLNSPDSSAAAQRGTRRTLVEVLDAILRLAHPIIPFITEEIWQRVAPLAGRGGPTIMTQPYPVADDADVDHDAVLEIQWVMSFVMAVRKIRSGMNIAPGKSLPILLQHGTDADRARVRSNHDFLRTLARLASIDWLEDNAVAPESATALIGDTKLLIPMAGLIDKEAEIARLGKELEKLRAETDRSQARLDNPRYVERAPSHVVARERERVDEMRASAQKLAEQLARIAAL